MEARMEKLARAGVKAVQLYRSETVQLEDFLKVKKL
jgi:hypothetical protein